MKSKRIIALLTAMIMSASLLAACGGNSNSNNTSTGDTSPAGNSTVGTTPAADAESGPAALEPITLTMFVTEPGEQPPMSNKVVEIIRERTGVTLEIEYLVGDMNQKVGILIASGSYPDIIGAGNARGEFLEAGALLALDDYLPNYPNLWRHYGEYADRLRGVSEDGKIYILDIWGRTYRLEDGEDDFYEAEYNGPAFWIQKDVLAWDNYANPTTLDDFFDLLARYYEAHPTIDGQPTLPFEVFSSDRFRSFTLRNAPQHLIGGRNEGDVVVNDDYSIEIYQNKDYAKRYYAKLNEVYKQGLIDQETFTRSFDQYVAAVSQGRVLAMFDQHWSFEQGEFVLVTEDKINRTYVPLGLSFDGPALPYNRVRDAGILGGNGIGISIHCKDVDRALSFMDALLDEDIQKLMYWGIEGEDYYVDEDGRFRRTPDQKDNFDNRDWRLANAGWDLGDRFPKFQLRFSDGNAVNSGMQPEERRENLKPYDIEFFSQYGYYTRNDFLPTMEHPGFPEVWSFLSTIPSDNPIRQVQAEMEDLMLRYLPGVIMANDFESAWVDYVARYERIDYDILERGLEPMLQERRYR